MRSPRLSSVAVALAAVALVILVVPVVALVFSVDAGSFLADITSQPARKALVLSLLVASTAALVALIFGTPLAWVLARTSFRGKQLVRSVVLVPLVLPPVVAGIALLSAFAPDKPVGRLLDGLFGVELPFSFGGAALAASFVSLPFFVLSVEAALVSLDRRAEQSAMSLGAEPSRVFFGVTVPQILPALATGLLLSWARALGEFGATVTFAGSIEGRTRTLPLEIYLVLESGRSEAVALSLVLLAISVAILVLLRGRWLTSPG